MAHNKCWDLVGGTAALTISKQMTHYAKVDVSGVNFLHEMPECELSYFENTF